MSETISDLERQIRFQIELEHVQNDVNSLKSDVVQLKTNVSTLTSDVAAIKNDVRWIRIIGGTMVAALWYIITKLPS